MMTMFDNYTFLRIAATDNNKIRLIKRFLADFELSIDNDVEFFIVAYSEFNIVACGGIAGNVLKSIAVSPSVQGDGFSLKLMTELTNFAYEMGRYNLFLFTKPKNVPLFRDSGFHPISIVKDHVALLENSKDRLKNYCKKLNEQKIEGNKMGCIVMNANPFTLGHQFLIKNTAKKCDWLHLFIVREEGNDFSFHDRYEMIKLGVQGVDNLTVHQGSEYIISRATFPTYFIKDKEQIDNYHTAIDLQIFRNYIAPALNITHRFVGSEPNCPVTNNYNQQMAYWLSAAPSKSPAIDVIETSRITESKKPISASRVRKLLSTGQLDEIQPLVPTTTYEYLLQRYAKASA